MEQPAHMVIYNSAEAFLRNKCVDILACIYIRRGYVRLCFAVRMCLYLFSYMLRSKFCFRPWESKHLKHFFVWGSQPHRAMMAICLLCLSEFVWYGSSCAHPQCICSICLARIHLYNVCFELMTPQPCPCDTGWRIQEQCQREFDFSINWRRNLLFTWPNHLQECTVHEGE